MIYDGLRNKNLIFSYNNIIFSNLILLFFQKVFSYQNKALVLWDLEERLIKSNSF